MKTVDQLISTVLKESRNKGRRMTHNPKTSFGTDVKTEELFSPEALSNSPHRPLRVLVACEESQKVCKAFRKLGHEAYSVDLIPSREGGSPEWHIQGDARKVLHHPWDLVIAHPPCEDLASSGARYFKQKAADGRQEKSKEFFLHFTEKRPYLDHVPYTVVENPVGITTSLMGRKPDQVYNPYDFGHPVSKRTHLWMKGLKPLVPTKVIPKSEWSNYYVASTGSMRMQAGQYEWSKLSNKKDASGVSPRKRARSETHEGVADAMATQWSDQIRQDMLRKAKG